MDSTISTTNQSFNLRPVNTNTTVRTTLAVSSVDNMSIKSICSTIKSGDVNNEWSSGGLAVTAAALENPARSLYPVISNNASLSASPQPIKAQNQVINNDLSGYSLNQQFLSSDYQENFPNVLGRNSYSLNNQSHNSPHVYQQQQQIQSFNHALHYVNKIKVSEFILIFIFVESVSRNTGCIQTLFGYITMVSEGTTSF